MAARRFFRAEQQTATAPAADVMRPGELRQRLGLGRSRFGELQQQGRFRHLEAHAVSSAIGARAYSRRKVDQFFADSERLRLVVRGA